MSQAQLVAQPVSDDHQRTDLPSPGLLRPAISLAQRELVRFLRQRHRIIGALATPLVFWLLIGGGMGRSLSFGGSSGESYIRFFFPGTLVMILLFTAIFSTISIIEDRREGFLQSVLVSPISRQTIVLGKVLGGTALATGQGLLFLLLAPLVGLHFTAISFLLCLLLMAIISFALTALGFCIAWRMSSTQGFHAIMNLFLMPMWFLSGALFPPDGAWWGLRLIMWLNPLTYGLLALRYLLNPAKPIGGPGLSISLSVTCVFAVGLFFLASLVARKTIAADLQ
ncbi:MAG TPA: ABC transporter permease [Tepidisphaeraceae bacterium]|jgi:ABC-2 type transport system permease protein|nr:ABC transporter permease [Tepidisphaeraceae bacterium]